MTVKSVEMVKYDKVNGFHWESVTLQELYDVADANYNGDLDALVKSGRVRYVY